MAELRDRILRTTYRMMLDVGISSMTMDLVARQCGISKRTLYEIIPDKRTLVWQSMLQQWQVHREESQRIVKNESNMLNGLLSVYLGIRKNFNETCHSFALDLERLYPDMYDEYVKKHREAMTEMIEFLNLGVKENVFRQDVNLSIATTLFFIETMNLKKNIGLFEPGTTFLEVLDSAFLTFIRGISSLKGIEILDKFIADNNIKPKKQQN